MGSYSFLLLAVSVCRYSILASSHMRWPFVYLMLCDLLGDKHNRNRLFVSCFVIFLVTYKIELQYAQRKAIGFIFGFRRCIFSPFLLDWSPAAGFTVHDLPDDRWERAWQELEKIYNYAHARSPMEAWRFQRRWTWRRLNAHSGSHRPVPSSEPKQLGWCSGIK